MLVAASSKRGKTQLVRDLVINHYRLFDKPLDSVIWLYHPNARDDELFDYLKDKLNVPITFKEGFPVDEIADGSLFDKRKLNLIVLDDVVPSAVRSPVFTDLFTVISHHQNVCVIAIMQNIHCETAGQRQLMNNVIRNLTFLVLFPDRRQLAACKQVSRTYFNGEEYKLLRPLQALIDEGDRFSYMLVDLENAKVCFNCLRPAERPFEFKFN
jgi:hypothetical protein